MAIMVCSDCLHFWYSKDVSDTVCPFCGSTKVGL
jgi:RNA polymerase subunit RPABC4/transcription elongation factor Spt4